MQSESFDDHVPATDDGDLAAELAAERAATEHWRRVARQRSADYAQLRHRPLVRAVLGVEWRLAPLSRTIATIRTKARQLLDGVVLALAGAGTAPFRRSGTRRADLDAALRRLGDPGTVRRSITVIAVGAGDQRIETPARTPDVAVVRVPQSSDIVASVRQAIDSSRTELVCLLLATTQPIDGYWLARLATEIHDDVVAATPLLVHPLRPPSRATPHDGRVRAAGLEIGVATDQSPVVQAAEAGAIADPDRPVRAVPAASPACLLLDRAGYEQAGGLPFTDALDVAVVELCMRMRAQGGVVVVVPGAVMVDTRRVRSLRELRAPIDTSSRSWRTAVDRSGAVFSHAGIPRPRPNARFALTVSAPSGKVAARWGDWHLAQGLADALRRRGHDADVWTLDHADDPAVRVADIHLVLRGVSPVRRTPGQRHVLWIISHPEDIEDAELDDADLVLVASERFADHLRTRTTTPVDVLLQATDDRRFVRHALDPKFEHEVTVVAKTRDVLRSSVADALSVGLRPALYGDGWRTLVDPALVVADYVPNETLPRVYSSAGVVLNDHWRTMQRWGFVSNRIYDVLACGTPVISDPVPGLAELFDGAVLEYRTPAELRAHVDRVLDDPAGAHERAARGRAAVLARHTFDVRAGELMCALARIGADPNHDC
jgi:hypothetical protein